MDAVERCAYLVAHVGEELALGLAGPFCVQPGQFQIGQSLLAFADIVAVAYVAHERAVQPLNGAAEIDYPAEFAVMSAQAVFHLKGSVSGKGFGIGGKAVFHVVRVHAFCPAVAHFLFHGPAGEIQPGGIEPVAQGVLSGAPDEGRSLVQYGEIELRRFGKVGLSQLARGDVDGNTVPQSGAVREPDRGAARVQPHAAVVCLAAVLKLHGGSVLQCGG